MEIVSMWSKILITLRVACPHTIAFLAPDPLGEQGPYGGLKRGSVVVLSCDWFRVGTLPQDSEKNISETVSLSNEKSIPFPSHEGPMECEMLKVQPTGSMEENLGCTEEAQQMMGETLSQMAWLSPAVFPSGFSWRSVPSPTAPTTRCSEAYSQWHLAKRVLLFVGKRTQAGTMLETSIAPTLFPLWWDLVPVRHRWVGRMPHPLPITAGMEDSGAACLFCNYQRGRGPPKSREAVILSANPLLWPEHPHPLMILLSLMLSPDQLH